MPSVVFMGRKPGAVVALEHLLESGWHIPCVVTPAGKTTWLPTPTLRDVAKSAGLDVFDWRQFRTALEGGELDEVVKGVEWVFSYLFPYLVPAAILELPSKGALNFHPAPLPDYGGLGGYNFAILEEQEEYGVTCHFMDEHFDTGDVVEVLRFSMDASCATALSLEAISQEYLIDLFRDIVDRIECDVELPRLPLKGATRYIDREEFERQKVLTSAQTGDALERHVRAFWYPPYDGAIIEIEGRRYSLATTDLLQDMGPQIHAGDLERLRQHAARGKKQRS